MSKQIEQIEQIMPTDFATEIKALPIEPSFKDLFDKILEQNKMIIETNNRILEILSAPALLVK